MPDVPSLLGPSHGYIENVCICVHISDTIGNVIRLNRSDPGYIFTLFKTLFPLRCLLDFLVYFMSVDGYLYSKAVFHDLCLYPFYQMIPAIERSLHRELHSV